MFLPPTVNRGLRGFVLNLVGKIGLEFKVDSS